ncbi:putative reverse transcriptase domain-containing protein [Tanacetum coccineum]|uniref:Reverse transcriptase domain-containing protein n=1 Tax=Tanacetum coccineum TaxID=301880 RepID=A0ABQ5EHV4_9ASTR
MVAATKPMIIQKVVQKFGTLTNEAIRNGSLKKNPEQRGNSGEPSRDRNVKDNNKRTRTENAFATTTNSILYRVDGGDFVENCGELWFIVINNPFWKIMPPRMRTQSAGRSAAESLGGGTGVRVGRGGRGRRPREGANRGVKGVNGNVEGDNRGAPDFSTIITQQLQNLLPAMLAQENIGNVIVNGNRIEKMESVHDISGCSVDQKVKYTTGLFVSKALTCHEMKKLESELWNHAMVGAGHAAYTDRFHELARLVPDLVTPKSRMIERYVYGLAPQIRRMVAATEPKTIQKAVHISGALIDEARTRTGNAFATTVNPIGRENTGTWPKNVNPVNARNPTVRACYECGSTDHVRNQGNQARGRALMLGAEEAHQDLNIMTGLEPSELGFKYEIEIASGQLVDIDKVIKGCKLEIEGYVFDIDLIPFGHGSFDVIIAMDWLSNYKTKIICHEKVVRIPLPYGKVLRVLGERPEEKVRLLMSAKANEKKQEEIVVVRDFLEVFLDDLSGLPPIREIEFRIELTPGATPVAKSPYRLAPSKLKELSGQLKELQDKGFIIPSSSPWGASVLFVKKKDGSFRMCIDYRELSTS